MRFQQTARAQRRQRIALFIGLAGLLTYSAAAAQSDKDWLETALEKTLRLSSPWELPVRPQLERTALPNGANLQPNTPAESTLVLEVPWGREIAKAKESVDEPTQHKLRVRLVDNFEDPWQSASTPKIADAILGETKSEGESHADVPVSTDRGAHATAIAPTSVQGTCDQEATEPPFARAYGKDLLLTDPWED